MSISINLDTSVITRGLKNLESGVKEAVQETLKKAADSAVDGAQSIVPVQTGALRDSIGIKSQSDNSVVVAAGTDYAAAVEFGTGGRPPQPYMGPQADRLQSEAPKMLKDALRSKL